MNCGGRILTQPKVSCQRQRDGCCEKCLSTSQSDMRHMTRWRRGFTCCCVWMPCHASPTAVPLQPTASCILSHDAHMTSLPYHMTLDPPPPVTMSTGTLCSATTRPVRSSCSVSCPSTWPRTTRTPPTTSSCSQTPQLTTSLPSSVRSTPPAPRCLRYSACCRYIHAHSSKMARNRCPICVS